MKRRLSLAILGAISVAAIALTAQSVVLVPGTITGNFALGSLLLDQVNISASPTSGGNSSSVSVNPNATSGSYSLTVGVPQSGTQNFNVYAGFYTDQYRDYLQTASVQVGVSAAISGQQNFNVTSVGFINASISVSGGTLQSAYIFASQGNGYAYTNAAPNYGFTFPALAVNNTSVSGTAYLTDGRQISLPNQTINVVSGQTASVSFSVTAPANSGSVAGTVQFNGPAIANQLYVYASGPMFSSFNSSPPAPDGSYLINGLVAGNYGLTAYMYLNNYEDYFQFPYSAYTPGNNVTIGTSQKIVDVEADQAFVNTQMTISGAPTVQPWLNSGQLALSGVSPSPAYGGYSYDQLSSSTSSFDSIVSPGTWRQDYLFVSFYRPAPYMYSYFYFYDNRPTSQVSIAAGETKSRNVDLALGELTISVSASGGALLSSPSVSGSCTYRDAANTVLWNSYVYAANGASNVSTTQLTLAAPGGTCSLSVSAYVNGSYVSLPASTFQIVAGASQVVDIGGPTLTITSPTADAIVGSNFVTVIGKATDDVAVASVSVNGTNVSLTPTGNPGDAAEVSFQKTVSGLQKGPNTITTVASDTSNPTKTTTDTRLVYYDTVLPTLAFTPADGFATFSTSVNVSGTGDDDAGVKKITINGVDTSFSSTANPSLPNQVSFTGSVSLSVGSNSITVVVTDISNRTTTQTHTVTRQQQAPTTLSVADTTATFGGTVSLSATLSSQGSGVGGKTVHFTVNGNSADAVTNASGVASVSGLSVSGLAVSDYPGAIGASFAGDANFGSNSGSAQLTITKATATLALGNLSQTYDGSPRAASITTAPAGLTGVSITYNGSPTAPTNAGSYAVVASLTNANYDAPNAAATLVINQASATLTLTGLTHTYDGSAKTATVTTAPVGLTGVAVTYDGSATAPTNAGNYMVVASLTNANYEAPNASATMAIGKANQTISFGAPANKTFGDPDFLVSATATSGLAVTFSAQSGQCTVTGNSVHLTGAGSCTIRASQGGDVNHNAATDADRAFTIGKASQAITITMAVPASAVYNTTFNTAATGGGSGNPVVIIASGACSVSAGGAGSATILMTSGMGSCTVSYNQAGDANYFAAPQASAATAALKATQIIVVTTGVPSTAAYGSSFTVAATGGASGNPVTYTSPAGDGCSDAGPTFTVLSGMTACQVLYNQAGNANYSAASQIMQAVNVVGYLFDGFFQPIDMSISSSTVWNSATAGQAIPIKWRLTLSGATVAALTSYVGMYSAEVSCGTGTGNLDDAIEEYASGASNITYDGNGNFHINWKTVTTYKGKCRAFYVSFSDGSASNVAYFKFK